MQGDELHKNANDNPKETYDEFPDEPYEDSKPLEANKPDTRTSIKKASFLRKHWASFTIISAACLLTAGFAYMVLTQVDFKTSETTDEIVVKKPAQKLYSKLSYTEIKNADDADKVVTGIMIENSPNARPQSGLKEAEMVFESIAEGGITRFLALYQVNKPTLIGPVRSVREYYIDWATPFEPSIAHVGGSATALSIIRSGKYRDIDQMFNGSYYWRSTDRYAPHNVYTNFEKLDALNQQRGYLKSKIDSFARQIPKLNPDRQITASTINLTISSQLYNPSWAYNQETNTYARSQAGAPHLDREKGQITANAIIAIWVNTSRVAQDGNRERVDSLGEGKAQIFQNGEVTEGTWKKPTAEQQIRFYDANGKEIAINAGQVWISAVPNASGNVTWN